MKLTKRILCFLLVLVTLLSLVPMFAAAEQTQEESKEETKEEVKEETKAEEEEEEEEKITIKVKIVSGSKTLKTINVEVGSSKGLTLKSDQYLKHNKKVYEFSHYLRAGKKYDTIKIPAYDGTAKWKKTWNNTISIVYKVHTHKYFPGFSRLYHWDICECGDTTKEVRHVDPATDSDKICTCGYHFSDNADIVTLWMENMNLTPRFNKDTTEYIGEVYTYKDVSSTSFSVSTFDALATLSLPTNTEIHEGANKFEFVVTAEDKKTTKTYTVIAVKPVKVENTLIGSDGTTVYTEIKAKVTRQVAALTIADAVGEKMAELAVADQCKAITFRPKFSKWSTKQVDLTFSSALLKSMGETAKADLVIETPFGSTLTIPAGELAAIADNGDPITVTVAKDSTFRLTAGEEAQELTDLPGTITLVLPEGKN